MSHHPGNQRLPYSSISEFNLGISIKIPVGGENSRPAVPAYRPFRFFCFFLRTLAFKCVFCEWGNGPLMLQEWSPWTIQKTQKWRNTPFIVHDMWSFCSAQNLHGAWCAADSRSGPWPLSKRQGPHQDLIKESGSISSWKSFPCIWNEDCQGKSRGTKCTSKT